MTSPAVRTVRRAMAAAATTASAHARMRREVHEGLSLEQKELPPKYFYDRRGSELFEEITALSEYYLTRTERAVLEARADEIVGTSGALTLVELGAGSSSKTRILLDALIRHHGRAHYAPTDVSAAFLMQTAAALRDEYPSLVVDPVVADFTQGFTLSPSLPGPRLIAFLGSTIGNFAPEDAELLLRRVRAAMRPGDVLLLGADLRKDVARIEAAYNDEHGVTAEFNRNMLRVINRELGADFDVDAFTHHAFYDGRRHRIEMHLVSDRGQVATVPGCGRYVFARGESVRTEISCKYDRPSLEALLASGGFKIGEWYTDPSRDFSLSLSRPSVRNSTPLSSRRSAEPGAAVRQADLRIAVEEAFAPSSGPPRIAAEVEAFVVHAETGRAARLATTLAALGDVPAAISFEPGGQLEYSAPPFESPSALLADIDGTLASLRERLAPADLALRFAGFDDVTPIDDVPMQKDAPRYQRMDKHFARTGPYGRLMMRQTASVQVCVDTGADPLGRWRLLSALAPAVAAAFANSPSGPVEPDGVRWNSSRRLIWSMLDPGRTGLRSLGADPVGEYIRFALDAPAFLLGDATEEVAPFRRWARCGATEAQWREHLTTLFPDVRPRGYFELRAADSVEGDALTALVLMVWALATDPTAGAAALGALPAPSERLMQRAGRSGLADPVVRAAATDALSIAAAALERSPRTLVTSTDVERAARAFDRVRSGAGAA